MCMEKSCVLELISLRMATPKMSTSKMSTLRKFHFKMISWVASPQWQLADIFKRLNVWIGLLISSLQSIVSDKSCGVHEQCWVCMACWSVSYVVSFCCCWTCMAHMIVLHAEGWWVSSGECLVGVYSCIPLLDVNEFCGVHIWQNGTRCRDGVKVF